MRPALGPAGTTLGAEALGLKILVVTDAWAPQVNGVVRTLEMLGRDLRALGHDVHYVTPEGRFTLPLPTYPEIRLSVFPRASIEREIKSFAPDAVHIATEGTLGMSARAICLRYGIPYTTSFHTRFPEYVNARFPFISQAAVYRWLRWFHAPATAMMVATTSMKRELEAHGFRNVRIWSRGVDVDHFRPLEGGFADIPKPIWLYVGRIAIEKNIEAFLNLDLPGTKVLIGDGPARATLAARFPHARFLGPMSGNALVQAYSASDVFVFPSRTDTFGLVILEALACGIPVAAYPVPGPMDILAGVPVGALDEDLGRACLHALDLARTFKSTAGTANLTPRGFALERSWRACTTQFLSNLAVEPPLPGEEAELQDWRRSGPMG